MQLLGKKTISLLLTAGFIMISVTGCGKSQSESSAPKLVEPVGVDVDTVKVKTMNLSSVQSFQGQIVPEIKGLYFVNSGNIGKMNVSVGDKVKKNELLATLSSADGSVKKRKKQLQEKIAEQKDANEVSKCDIDQKREELSQLTSQWKKAKNKKQKAGLKIQVLEKRSDIETAELQLKHQKQSQQLELKQMKADIRDAQEKTKSSKLISPVNGEVISTAGGAGYMVQGGTTAINIANMEHPRIRTEYIGASSLAKASSYMATINGKQYHVKVEEQEVSQFDIEMNKYPSYTWFDFVEDVNVSVGDSATIDLYNDTADAALVVPSNAVFKTKKSSYVYIMKGNSKIKRDVTTGTITDAYTQLLTGVKEGDVVYVQD